MPRSPSKPKILNLKACSRSRPHSHPPFTPYLTHPPHIRGQQEKGFTEPDPRDDLGGVDVARKVVIIARECGMNVELSDVPIKSLVRERE